MGFNDFQFMRTFLLRKWKKSTLNDLIRINDKTGSADFLFRIVSTPIITKVMPF